MLFYTHELAMHAQTGLKLFGPCLFLNNLRVLTGHVLILIQARVAFVTSYGSSRILG
jgi:hypothetical protein